MRKKAYIVAGIKIEAYLVVAFGTAYFCLGQPTWEHEPRPTLLGEKNADVQSCQATAVGIAYNHHAGGRVL